VTLRKIALVASLILVAVGSYAAYTSYTESKSMTFGAGQTKAWIFGSGPYPEIEKGKIYFQNPALKLTPEELAQYPTTNAYIDYINSNPGIMPLNSMSIDTREARSLLFLFSQNSIYWVTPQTGSNLGEWYSFNLEVSGTGYGINIVFGDERPILD